MDRKYVIQHELESLLAFICEGSGLTPTVFIEENLSGVKIAFRTVQGGVTVYSKRYPLNQDVLGVFIDLRTNILELCSHSKENGGMDIIVSNIEKLYHDDYGLFKKLIHNETNILLLESYIQELNKEGGK